MEFDKYEKFGKYHWTEYEQHTTYGVHADKVAKWVEGEKLLDIGAGDGLITSLLIKKGIDCVGIDDNELAVKLANEERVPVVLGNAYHLSFEDEMFDTVLMADVIEHFEYPGSVLREVSRVLKPNGILYITTPPKKEGEGLHDRFHFREYSPDELVEFLRVFGFKLVEPTEVKYVRIYGKFQKI